MAEEHDRLSDADALIWRIEGDPVLRSPVTVVGLLDRTPDPERLDAAVARAVAAIPRLRLRLVDGTRGRRPRWVADEGWSPLHHVRWVASPRPDPLEGVLAVATPDVMTAFDPARPLWQLTVVAGRDPAGPAGFVLRFHHTITDGVGGVGLAHHLFDARRRPAAAAVAAGAGPSRPRPPGPSTARTALAVAGAATGAVAAAVRDPLGSTRAGVRMGRSVARMLAPAHEPLSPVLRGRGLDRHLHVIDLSMERLHEAARRAGGTVNDALLAAVGGGVHAYHAALGVELPGVRVTMPINVRSDDDAEGGNHFTPARLVLAVDDPDPARRIALAGGQSRACRAEPAIGLTSALAWGMDRLPTPLVRRAFAGMLRSVDVDVVDVPGRAEPSFLAGARVERMWAFAPPTGAALSVTLLSHGRRACVAVASDLAAVDDPERLAACFEAAFDDVLALARRPAPSEVPT